MITTKDPRCGHVGRDELAQESPVLAAPGWRAYWDGEPVAILQADHAVRGVIVPAGATTVDFRYEPRSFRLGLWMSGLAAMVVFGWLGTVVWRDWFGSATREEQP